MENMQQFLALMCEAAVGACLGVAAGLVITLVLVAIFRACPVACQAKFLGLMGRKL